MGKINNRSNFIQKGAFSVSFALLKVIQKFGVQKKIYMDHPQNIKVKGRASPSDNDEMRQREREEEI